MPACKRPSLDPLPEFPSKAEEMTHLREFVAQLPFHSYLRSFLEGADEFAERAMLQDLSIELLSATRRARSELNEDIHRMAKELEKMRSERDALKKETSALLGAACRVRDYSRDAGKALATCLRDFEQVSIAATNLVVDQNTKGR